MTDSTELPQAIYPEQWHMFDAIEEIECRRISIDTYQLRSPTHIITLNEEGFELYRDGSPEGVLKFSEWMGENHVIPVRRDDI